MRDREQSWEPAHGINMKNAKPCPKCGSMERKVVNYELAMLMGDVICANCGEWIRVYDAG